MLREASWRLMLPADSLSACAGAWVGWLENGWSKTGCWVVEFESPPWNFKLSRGFYIPFSLHVWKMWKTCPGSPNTRTRAHGEAHIKEAAFGRLHKGGRPSAAPLCGFLYMGLSMGTGSCIWAAWAGLPHFYCAYV